MVDVKQVKLPCLAPAPAGGFGEVPPAPEALAALPVAVAVCLQRGNDAEPLLVEANRAFERLVGQDSAALMNRSLRALSEPACPAPLERRARQHFARAEALIETLVLRRSEGPPLEVTCEWTPLSAGAADDRYWTATLTHGGAEQAERALMRSEREAARSKAFLLEAIESMSDGFVWFDSEGRLALCNERYRELFPKLADDFKPGASYSNLMKLAFDRDQLTVLANGNTRDKKYEATAVAQEHPTFRTKTSEGRWIEARNHPLEAGGFIGVRFDITARVAAEDALKESEQRFKDFAQASPGGFWEMDETLRLSSFLDVQNGAGHPTPTAVEATGQRLWELFVPTADDDAAWRSLPDDLAARRPIQNLRGAYESVAGQPSYWRINGKPYYDSRGRFRGYRGIAEDETVAVEARKRVEAAEARVRDAIESISDGFALFDADDRMTLCNETYRERAYDKGRHVVPGITFEELCRINAANSCVLGMKGPEEVDEWVQRRMAVHQSGDRSFELNWHDGRTFLMTERRTREGGIATVSTDITELKRARELAEQANQDKTRFLAAASHDLRQPLHAVELFIAALEEVQDAEEARGIAADLREASDAAGRLLNALLDVSELESGKLEGRFVEFPVQRSLDSMVRVYGPQARERGLQLKMVPSSQIVCSDPNLLERILGNLVSNAVRYTPEGRILIGCRRRSSKLRIEVWDTGQGIPEEEHDRIFEEFRQLDNPVRQRRRGVGLGLSIVRRLANILGHEIFLHSVRERGSAFSVELDPVGRSMSPVEESREGPAPLLRNRGTVLVLDDDPQVRKAMCRALEAWGATVIAAKDRESAAASAAASASEIELIIADYRLSCGYNGVEAVKKLRRLIGRETPVLMVTADYGEAEMLEIVAQGFPALTKPVSPQSLRAALAQLLGDRSTSASQIAGH